MLATKYIAAVTYNRRGKVTFKGNGICCRRLGQICQMHVDWILFVLFQKCLLFVL